MPAALSSRDLSDLIGRIYDCALEPQRWDAALDALRSALRCKSAQLALVDLPQRIVLIQKTLGIEPPWLELQSRYLPEIVAFTERHLDSGVSIDEPLVTSRLATAAQYAASPYFQEWGRPQGYVDVVQINVIRTPTRMSGLGMGRHESVGVLEEPEIELLRLLVPHVRRAVTISNVLNAQTIESRRLAETLDALRLGVVLANADSRILHANRAAEEMMRGGALLRDSRGVLRMAGRAAAREIAAAIRHAARDETGIGKAGLAVALTEADEPAVAHVLPLASGDVRTRLEAGAVAAVFISPAVDDAASAGNIARAFGLTPAETRMLTRVLTGGTVAEAAADLGIAPTTGRTHLDRIFAKTRVSRQSELIRLAAQMAPPTRGPVGPGDRT